MNLLDKYLIVNKIKDYLNLSESEAKRYVCDCLNLTFTQFHLMQGLSISQTCKITNYARKTKKGKPLNKILKRANFFGRDFFINNNVLAPRPETEEVVEVAIDKINGLSKTEKSKNVLDLCCGSGIIGITLALECRNVEVTCADISSKALKVAKTNDKKFNSNIVFVRSNMLEKIQNQFNVIVCNPPYIPLNEYAELDISVKKYDPKIALVGGETGFEFYEYLSKNAHKNLKSNGTLICEIGYNQGEKVSEIFSKTFKNVEVLNDVNGNNRIVIAKGVKND